MTRFKPWPRSLAGQMALLIALALGVDGAAVQLHQQLAAAPGGPEV